MDNNSENRKIVAEIALLKEEQSEISIVREFAKHAKLQRKIIKLNEQLKSDGILLKFCNLMLNFYNYMYFFFSSKRKYIQKSENKIIFSSNFVYFVSKYI